MWSRPPSCAPPCPSCTLCTYLYTTTLAFNISLTTFMNAFVFTASSSDSYSPSWSGHSPTWQPPWWCCPSPSESNCPPPSNHHPTSLQQPLPTLLSPLASVGPRGIEILKERFFWDTLYNVCFNPTNIDWLIFCWKKNIQHFRQHFGACYSRFQQCPAFWAPVCCCATVAREPSSHKANSGGLIRKLIVQWNTRDTETMQTKKL